MAGTDYIVGSACAIYIMKAVIMECFEISPNFC